MDHGIASLMLICSNLCWVTLYFRERGRRKEADALANLYRTRLLASQQRVLVVRSRVP